LEGEGSAHRARLLWMIDDTQTTMRSPKKKKRKVSGLVLKRWLVLKIDSTWLLQT
jgi:hypothetical protein